MKSIEQELSYLEYEAKAIKASFERQASTIPVFDNEASITTTPNLCKYRYYVPEFGEYVDYEVYDYERIEVTFSTSSGMDTIASIEVDSDSEYAPKIRRINYRGGAKWIVSSPARMEYAGNPTSPWKPTTYRIAVHTMAEGTLNVGNIAS